MFKPEEFQAKTKEIMENLTDQAKVSEILAELTTDHIETVKVHDDNVKIVETTTADNKKLQEANLKLFLMVGEKPKQEQTQQTEETVVKVEDFLDGKGHLK